MSDVISVAFKWKDGNLCVERNITSLFYLPEAIYETVLLFAKGYDSHYDVARGEDVALGRTSDYRHLFSFFLNFLHSCLLNRCTMAYSKCKQQIYTSRHVALFTKYP